MSADGCRAAELLDDDGDDRISGLPTHLLHDILIRLPGGAAAAARTSILSRRWRRVWAHLPALSLDYSRLQPESPGARAALVARIDAALAAHAAGTTLTRLEIVMPPISLGASIIDGRVSAWLRAASERLTGDLRIALPYHHHHRRSTASEDKEEEVVVVLPLCERATSINLDLKMRILRLPPAGAFRALATLKICLARIDGGELEAALSPSRCPRLVELVLRSVAFFSQRDGGDVVSIRSGSLERLEISVFQPFDARLHVDAPKLRIFHSSISADFRILAPDLSEVRWLTCDDYDSSRHHLAPAGHRLRRLQVRADSPGSALMRQFNTVDELDLTVYLPKGVQKYEQFLKNTGTVVRCNVLLVIFVAKVEHDFKPAMVHLLRKCVGIRRLVVQLSCSMNGYPCKLSSGCPCSRFESSTTHSVVLDSLEEVVINDHGEVDHKVELVRLLCRCSTTFHRRVAITVIESRKLHYMRKKIQGICPQNSNVQIAVRAM